MTTIEMIEEVVTEIGMMIEDMGAMIAIVVVAKDIVIMAMIATTAETETIDANPDLHLDDTDLLPHQENVHHLQTAESPLSQVLHKIY